jgi:hypothetical protein
MRSSLMILIFLMMTIPAFMHAQQGINCDNWGLEFEVDLVPKDSTPFSMCMVSSLMLVNSEMVFCPAGIERSSSNDRKKRQTFDWKVKYDNIYIRSSQGIVFEGMNEHGFSASLKYLKNSQLSETDTEHIPIAASLAVNFFIDHFKCVDTALLAVWDIRIFDDLGLECGWPFRIILHDTTGASAFIEYIKGERRVYTPEPPAIVIGGPDYARHITLEYMPDSVPKSVSEMILLDLLSMKNTSNMGWKVLDIYQANAVNIGYFGFLRYHSKPELYILFPSGDEAEFNLNEIEFIPGKEVSEKFF